MRPFVTVVVAAYDSERHIAATLDSALAQEHHPMEVIVIDDGSTDATAEIVERYDVRMIRRANGGQGAAKNTGVAAARGELIAFLDHDDLWAPGKIARQVEALAAAPDAAGALVRLEVLLEPGVPHPEWLPRSREYPWFPPSSWLVRRSAFDRIGLFDEASNVPDFDWMLRARDLGLTFAIVPEVLGTYRIHGRNASYGRQGVTDDAFLALRRSLDRIRADA
jgi:glycosyltransferase involved in cell wall biosynthesis